MKCLFSLGILMLITSSADAALVTFTSQYNAISGKGFYFGRSFGGIVGDTVDLPEGKHHFSVKAEHNYDLNMTIEVKDGIVQVASSSPMRWESCIKNRVSQFDISNWPEPAVIQNGEQWRVEIKAPAYKNVGDQGECKSSSSSQTLAKLGGITTTIESEPTGAEFYIRGKKVGITNSEVVIPFTSDRLIDVVVRKPGYANCSVDLQPPKAGDSTETISCEMTKL